MTLALVAAVGAAIGYGAGSVLQAAATRRKSGLRVLAEPLYLIGVALDLLGWLASLVALRSLPLFAVQSLLAGSLVTTVVLARIVLGVRMRPTDRVAVVAVTGALAVLALAAGEQPAGAPPAGFTGAVVAGACVLAVVAAVAYRSGGATVLAALGGLGFSGAALAARGAHGGADGWHVVLQPLAVAVVLCGVAGALAYVRALERGAVGPATALVAVIEVVVPGVVGVAVLGDSVRAGWPLAAIVATVVALAGCVVLAGSPGQRAAA
jgi:hypothetical protein